jgi:ABC-2 type transport system permease protein
MAKPTFPRSSRAHGGRAGVRGLMAGHGASAEIFWALGWSAAFIVVFGTLTMRLCSRR